MMSPTSAEQILAEFSDECKKRLRFLLQAGSAEAQYPEDSILALSGLIQVVKAGELEVAGGLTELGRELAIHLQKTEGTKS